MNLFAKILLILMILPVSALSQVDEEYAHTIDSLKALLNDKNLADTDRLQAYVDIFELMTDYGEDAEVVSKYSDGGIALAEQLADTSVIIYLTNKIAWNYSHFYDERCFEYFFKALTLAEASGDTASSCSTLWGIAAVSSNLADYGKSLDYCNKSLDLAIRHHDTLYIYGNYKMLSATYYNMDLYGLAFENIKKASSALEGFSGANYNRTAKTSIAYDIDRFKLLDDVDDKFRLIVHLDSLLVDYTKEQADLEMDRFALIDFVLELYPYITDASTKRRASQIANRWFDYHIPNDEELYPLSLSYMLHLKYYTVIGNYQKAKEYVPSVLKYLEYGDMLENLKVLSKYYKAVGDYKTANNYFAQYLRLYKTNMNLEFAVKSETSQAEREYLAQVHAQDIAAKERDIRFQESTRANAEKNRWLIGIGTLVVIALIFIIYYHNVAGDQNSLLRLQTERIYTANEELNSQQEEIIAQRDELNEQTKQLTEQRNSLHYYNNRLVDSITYAERIQRAMVPKEDDVRKIFPESFVIWHPRDIVSGDFYWTLRTENYSYLVTADCTGHGVPGALISMLGISYLNDISSIMDTITTGEILDMLKAKVSEALSMSNQNVDDGMDLAIYRITNYGNADWTDQTDERRFLSQEHGGHRITQINTEEATPDGRIKNQKLKIINVQFSGAFRPLFVYRDGELMEQKADRMSVSPDHFSLYRGRKFKTIDLELQSGDMLYTFSDGIEDQLGGDTGKQKYTLQQLRQLLSTISTKPVTVQRDNLESAIQEWQTRSNSFQLDDQLIIGVRVV